MQISSEGSVRVDLVGGTLDLEPIHMILPDVVTLNVATSLKAKVDLESNQESRLVIISKDYNKTYEFLMSDLNKENLKNEDFFKEMRFVALIVDTFNLKEGITISLSSGAPAGSGLGGSSAMAITLYKAFLSYKKETLAINEIVSRVKNVEGRILNQGVPGYQDYYPALTGGILSLYGDYKGIHFDQLYTKELKEFLESNLMLIYSGISRNSGINNWEVYKAFFDGDQKVKSGMEEIAKVSYECQIAIKESRFDEVLNLIAKEGELREKLFKGIVPEEIKNIYSELLKHKLVTGMKMCGAGGGGCFLIITDKQQEVRKLIEEKNMTILPFEIEAPIHD